MSNRLNLSSKIALVLSVFGLLAPAGYLMGCYFYEGILSGYGVDTSVFTLSTYGTYVNAYFAIGYLWVAFTTKIVYILNTIFSPPALYISGLVFASVVLTIYFIIVLKERLKSSEKVSVPKWLVQVVNYVDPKKNRLIKSLLLTGGISYVSVMIAAVIMMLALFWFVIPKAAYDQGKTVSAYQIEQFDKFKCSIPEGDSWNKCHQLIAEDGEVLVEGLLAAQDKEYVAFYTTTHSVVLKFPASAKLVRRGLNITKQSR